jgi:hypothetical protein
MVITNLWVSLPFRYSGITCGSSSTAYSGLQAGRERACCFTRVMLNTRNVSCPTAIMGNHSEEHINQGDLVEYVFNVNRGRMFAGYSRPGGNFSLLKVRGNEIFHFTSIRLLMGMATPLLRFLSTHTQGIPLSKDETAFQAFE